MASDGSFDIVIVGGGTGGVAAAIAACSQGCSVALTEEFSWLGGQLTSQLVPPDEHGWIDKFGSTRRYRALREGVRQYCREFLPLSEAAKKDPILNPGRGWVSRLCHEPRIGWQVILQMLQPHLSSGRLKIFERCIPISADCESEAIRSVVFRHLETGDIFQLDGSIFIDASELGDLLPLTETDYVTGAESKSDTGEEHALDGPANPQMMQGITWCAALAYDPGSSRVTDRPESYDYWSTLKPSNWPSLLFSFTIINPITGASRELPLFSPLGEEDFGLFTYRRILDPELYEEGSSALPVTVVNWPQNDYYMKSVCDVPDFEKRLALEESREQTRCLLYWLQTEAPRHDGGTGYPGLFFDGAFTGTLDGLAQAPYIRESRRIKARFRITEDMVNPELRPGQMLAQEMPRSVGVGSYRMDIHPCTSGGPTIDLDALPYQIPAGALMPASTQNLLAGAKNIGTTHITNGCYRLHPTEWNIGESAGLIAAFCIQKKTALAGLLESDSIWSDFERLMAAEEIETAWPSLSQS